jgi:hypothetical protein
VGRQIANVISSLNVNLKFFMSGAVISNKGLINWDFLCAFAPLRETFMLPQRRKGAKKNVAHACN